MEWIDVNDNLPDVGECRMSNNMLVANIRDKWVSMGYYDTRKKEWYDIRDDWCPIIPTHWMPPPELYE